MNGSNAGVALYHESINRKKNNKMAAYCAEHSHSWLYIRPAGDYASPGHGGEVDHFSFTGRFRFVVVEGAFAAEADEPAIVKSLMYQVMRIRVKPCSRHAFFCNPWK